MQREHLFDAALGVESLEAHVRELAELPVRRLGGAPDPRPVLARLAKAQQELAGCLRQGEELLPASAWFLDHYPFLEEMGEMAVRERRRRKPLPALPDGTPRAYALMREAVAHTDAHVDEDIIKMCARTWLTFKGLRMRELWSLPQLLRVALLFAAGRVAGWCVQAQLIRRKASAFVQEALSSGGLPGELPPDLMGETAVEHIFRLLRGEEETLRALDAQLAALDLSRQELVDRHHRRAALEQLRMSGVVQSLHKLSELSWSRVYEEICPVEQILRSEPTGVYEKCDFESRELLRRAVARFAQTHPVTETRAAREAVALAAQGPDPMRRQVGYYLLGEGRDELSRRQGGATLGYRLKRSVERHGKGLYMGGVLLAAALLTALAAFAGGPLLAVLTAFPALSAAQRWLGRGVTALFPPRLLLKLDYSRGIPDAARTAVCLPVLLSSPARAREYARNLELHYLANPLEGLVFVLLGDFADHQESSRKDDASITHAAMEEIHLLNLKYGERFYYLHRPRSYNRTQRRYMGWERKRGAQAQFNRALLTGSEDAFCVANLPISSLSTVKYVITLDGDTVLGPGDAARLVGAAAHPLNRRHGVLAPRVCSLNDWGLTRFAQLLSGRAGVDTYVTAVSETYQDLCGEGIYGGKGIYAVKAFEAATAHLPQNAILSHDLLEGLLAGAAQLSDVAVYEKQPATLRAWGARQHRWTRGDWQLLPFLSLPGLGGLSRWKILDNLRRSLSPLFAVLAGVLCGWQGLAVLLLEMGLPRDKAYFVRLMLLPWQAVLQLDAAARTLWRVLISRRHLLEWVTAADMGEKRELTPGSLWMCFAAGALSLSPVLLPLWGLAGLLLPYLRSPAWPRPELTGEDEDFLRDLASRTYGWFTQFMTERDHDLPPDNVQYEPYRGVAHRTSPTNIGYALCAQAAAWDLGLISAPEMAERLGRTLKTIEQLEKWHGHLYNWYDTLTLEPLPPRYVSSVDSGNLAAALWAAAAALEEAGELGLAARCEKLVRETDFSALYDGERDLFYIGFDSENGRMSGGHYDLLASEAQLLSFIAIAKGDAPLRHYRALGRPVTRVGRQGALLSWSGTMFEYLMPALFLRPQPDTLFARTLASVVRAQREAARNERPWGESESGYYAFDLALNYQYKAFGLLELSMQGGIKDEVVVSPYAGALALLVEPDRACHNLKHMAGQGWMESLGFLEAADYTPQRRGDKPYALVRSQMVHHQGMTLLALEAALGDKLRQRFMRLPQVRAYALLLQERGPDRVVPRRARIKRSDGDAAFVERHATRTVEGGSRVGHLLSGAGTMLMVDAQGNGYAKKDGRLFWRYTPDGPGPCGLLFYLDGVRMRPLRAQHAVDKTVLMGGDGQISWEIALTVSPEDGAVAAKVDLCNQGLERRNVSLTAYLEPVLCAEAADRSHRAFQDLFLQLRQPAPDQLTVSRRPRGQEEAVYLTLALSGDGAPAGAESSRNVFIGRGRTTEHPKGEIRKVAAAPVEVCAALRRALTLEPGGRARVTAYCNMASGEAPQPCAPALQVDRAFELAAIRAQVEIGYFMLDSHKVRLYERAAFYLTHPELTGGERLSYLKEAELGQEGLWRFGLSGDLPLCTVRVHSVEEAALARQCLDAHSYWTAKGLQVDLVLVNEYGNDYRQPVREQLSALLRPHVHLVEGAELSAPERALLFSRSALLLSGKAGSLEEQVRPYKAQTLPKAAFDKAAQGALPLPPVVLEDENEYGGFTPDGSQYVITAMPPAPWSDVLANPGFGSLVTDRFGGYTFWGNSRTFRLTPFSNDSVSDPLGEGVFVRDEESGQVFDMTGRVRMGQGVVIGESGQAELLCTRTVFVDRDKPVKYTLAALGNPSVEPRRVTVWAWAKWVLGEERATTAMSIETWRKDNLLLARNHYGGRGVAFLGVLDREMLDFSCDGRELTQASELARLSGRTGAGMPPCALLRVELTVPPGQMEKLCFVLGAAKEEAEALQLAKEVDPVAACGQALDEWERFLDTIQIDTPNARLNRLCNRWLPYQALAGRFFARTGFYQSGGAFGFRDQLQDAAMLAFYRPQLLREHLLTCAAHQFEEGDVQHWWHPPARGVRTRISDDLLFLPWAAAQYVRRTGDRAVLAQQVPFLKGEPVPEGQEDLYFTPETGESGSLREHCLQAIRRAARFGPHGLPLMGGGDWNDAMNRVGLAGKGESVFVGWFLCLVIRDFLPLAQEADKPELQILYERTRQALEESAFEGQWYRRAFYDDGAPMGGRGAKECEIDLLAQAFSVLSGAADPQRARGAMESALDKLYVPAHRMVKLLDPPFVDGDHDPGYIKGYLAGVRENGGQYTHAAAWAVLALCALDDARAGELLLSLLPAGRNADRYRVEPYVAAADIYAGEQLGRGGWTWYTGSAGWLWRAAVEGVLGLRLTEEGASLAPCPPAGWEQFSVTVNGQTLHWKREQEP